MSCFRRPQSEPYNYAEYVEACNELGVADIERQLAKMIVCDFLTANIDRHDMNLGLIRDSETLQFVGVTPLFDNGRGFYYSATRIRLRIATVLPHFASLFGISFIPTRFGA